MAIFDPFSKSAKPTSPLPSTPQKEEGGISDPFFGQTLEAPSGSSAMAPMARTQEYAGKFAPEYVEEMLSEMNMPGKVFAGVGGGMYMVGKGVQQLGAEAGKVVGLVKPETVKEITRQGMDARDFLDALESKSNAVGIGEFAGQTLPMLPIPGGVAGGALKRAGTAAATGGAIGATQFVPEGGDRLQNMMMAAALAGGTSAALSTAGKVGLATAGKVPKTQDELQAEKWNIPLTRGEATGNVALQKREVLLERAPGPLGIKDFRTRQNEASNQAAKDYLAKYVVDPLAGDVGLANRQFVNGLYEEVRGLVGQVKNPLLPTKTRSASRELLGRYPDTFKILQDTKTERLLKGVAKDTGERVTQTDVFQGDPTVQKLFDILGLKDSPLPIVGKIETFETASPLTSSFEDMWELVKGLGDKVGQARKLLAAGKVDKTQYSQIVKIRQAALEDMDDWANQIKRPDITQKLKAANEAYRNHIVKYDAVQRAYDKASGTVGAGEVFSPKTFSTLLGEEAYRSKTTGKFTPPEIDEMTGLATIMQVVKRAGQFAENPPTGNRLGPLVATAELAISPSRWKALAYGATTAGISKFLSVTKAGKNLARTSSKIEPNSPAMSAIMRQIYNQSGKFVAEEYFRRQRSDLQENKYPIDLQNPSTWPSGFGTDRDLADKERELNIPENQRGYGAPQPRGK